MYFQKKDNYPADVVQDNYLLCPFSHAIVAQVNSAILQYSLLYVFFTNVLYLIIFTYTVILFCFFKLQ